VAAAAVYKEKLDLTRLFGVTVANRHGPDSGKDRTLGLEDESGRGSRPCFLGKVHYDAIHNDVMNLQPADNGRLLPILSTQNSVNTNWSA